MEKIDVQKAVLDAMTKASKPEAALADGLIALAKAVEAVQAQASYAHAWVVELQKRPDLLYTGTWKADCEYQHGHFATAQGSLWHCQRNKTEGEEPGTGPNWILAVKGMR